MSTPLPNTTMSGEESKSPQAVARSTTPSRPQPHLEEPSSLVDAQCSSTNIGLEESGIQSVEEDIYANAPDLALTLSHLEHSTQRLAQSLAESVAASSTAIESLSTFAVNHFADLATAAHQYSTDVVEATAQADAWLAKCVQLDVQLSRMDRFEVQLAQVQRYLPELEKMVDAHIAEYKEKNKVSNSNNAVVSTSGTKVTNNVER